MLKPEYFKRLMSILQIDCFVEVLMENYNDFAMPSLENIEQMAKSYKMYEEKNLKLKQKLNFYVEDAKKIYENIYRLNAIVEYLYKKYNKNQTIIQIFNTEKKLKLYIDGLFVDYDFKEPDFYNIAENTAVQDICIYSTNVIRYALKNIHCIDALEISRRICDIIELTVSY